MQRMARLEVVGARARTPNIKLILVTRDVSKFSGWLKADAVVVSIDRRGVVDVRDRRRNTEKANMKLISVTLDVSKLSGWLNFFACCRVARTAHEAGCEVRARR